MPSRQGRNRQLLRDQGGHCPGCGRTLEEIEATSRLTQDHIVPRNQGGTRNHDNLVAVCDDCNQRKANRWPWNWFGEHHLIYVNPAWILMRKRNRLRCSCGTWAVPIAYGFPSPELIELAERGRVCLGGCIVLPDQPGWYCRHCKKKF